MDRGVNQHHNIVLNATLPEGVALCGAIGIEGSAAPDWIQLLPAGTQIRTHDGRGPYNADLNQLAAQNTRLVLDENHSTDLAAPMGLPAPAMGWITELQARPDGLWGHVEWTEPGRALVAGRAYRGISPVLDIEAASKRVRAVLRASLVNRPNIKDLVALNQETDMNPLLKKLIAALGLKDDVSEDTLVTAVTALHQARQAHSTELQSIAGAAGIKAGDTVTGETILAAIGRLKAAGDATSITALQQELTTVTTELNSVKAGIARTRAETFVDDAIKQGRVGVKPLRDHYITRHMANPAEVEKEIAAFPRLDGSRIVPSGTPREGEVSLNAADAEVARQLGLTAEQFNKSRASLAAA